VKDYAILMLDAAGHVTSWNEGAERIKGYRAEEIVGRHFSIFYTPEAVDAGHPQAELDEAKSEGRYEEEGWRVRKDGSRFWASVVITALRDQEGNLRGFGKVTRDYTERKRVEETLRHYAAEVAATNRELEAFSYSVSHDLRAPLRAIDGFSKILLEKGRGALDQQGQHYLERIRASSQKMGELIDGLLALARVTRSELRLREVARLPQAISLHVAEDRPVLRAGHHDRS
jgi:PAS domain S-box-containing protein